MTHREQTGICNCVLIALGANLGGQKDSPLGQVEAALEEITQSGLTISKRSRAFLTPSFPRGSGPDFVNLVIKCVSDLAPEEILARLHQIERWAGRTRRRRWEPRVLDLDLLAVGDCILPDAARFNAWAGMPLEAQKEAAPDELVLPHPRLHERAFVLVPLMDIAPDWRHPALNKTISELFAALEPEQLAGIRPILP